MANSAYWFRHDSNAKDDHKIMLLIDQLGLEGYGIYWILVETLREQDGYRYPVAMLPILAKRYATSGEKMKAVVMSYELFEVDEEDLFFSPSLLMRMGAYDAMCLKNRQSGSIGGKKKAEKKLASAKQVLSEVVADAKRGDSGGVPNRIELNRIELNREEKKEGEGVNAQQPKAKTVKRFTAPEKQDVADFFHEHGSTVEEAGKFWYHFDASGWTLGNGRKMKSWQSAAHKWIINSKTKYANGNGTQTQRRNGTLADQQPIDDAAAIRIVERIAADPRYA